VSRQHTKAGRRRSFRRWTKPHDDGAAFVMVAVKRLREWRAAGDHGAIARSVAAFDALARQGERLAARSTQLRASFDAASLAAQRFADVTEHMAKGCAL